MSSKQLLEQYKIEQLAEQLAAEGYEVQRPHAADHGADLVASRGVERIAFQVLVPPVPEERLRSMDESRRRLLAAGFTQVRTVVASLPRRVNVEVDGLPELLRSALAREVPAALALLHPLRIDAVEELEYEQLTVRGDGTHVTGRAMVALDGTEADPEVYRACPVDFTAVIDPTLSRADIVTLSVQMETAA